MSATTGIEWTDATWNPVTGCDEVSPGCDNCYAKTFAERFRGTPGHYFEQGFDVVLRPGKLTLPLSWKKPKRVFVNSMSDLFHKDVPDDYIAQVFAVMGATPQHTYQVLTKRHGRMRSLLRSDAFRALTKDAHVKMQLDGALPYRPLVINAWPLKNVWLGVSVEDQQRANLRVPALLETPAAKRFLSCEPLLGSVWLRHWLPVSLCDACEADMEAPMCAPCYADFNANHVDWVIVGGESGAGYRSMELGWARSLRDQCADAGVPFLFKQVGGRTPKAGGRELDGRTHDEFPESAA
jgi:protein gp37